MCIHIHSTHYAVISFYAVAKLTKFTGSDMYPVFSGHYVIEARFPNWSSLIMTHRDNEYELWAGFMSIIYRAPNCNHFATLKLTLTSILTDVKEEHNLLTLSTLISVTWLSGMWEVVGRVKQNRLLQLTHHPPHAGQVTRPSGMWEVVGRVKQNRLLQLTHHPPHAGQATWPSSMWEVVGRAKQNLLLRLTHHPRVRWPGPQVCGKWWGEREAKLTATSSPPPATSSPTHVARPSPLMSPS